MFSQEQRSIYSRNQLGEVICQLRFPEILTINPTPPADFQEAIREDFPVYTARKEAAVLKPGTPPQQPGMNYQFATADGVWRVNLTSRFISLATSRYTRWEDFAAKLDKPLAAFIRVYRPAYFERVGLRYLNFISRNALDLNHTPFSALISPAYLGLLGDPEVSETAATRATVDAEVAIRAGCRAKIHAGPGMVRRPGQSDAEPKFILDFDLYMPGKLALNLSAGALHTLHAQAYPIFRSAITDTLHEAMEPTQI